MEENMRTLTCPPGTEIIGTTLLGFSQNLQSDDVKPVMEKHGVVNLDPMGWYPAQMLLDALNDIAAYSNFSTNMVAIGMKIGEIVPVPPELGEKPSLEDVLMIWDDLYQGLHRNTDVGGITIEKVHDNYFKTFHTVIYPDDMSYGVLYGYARRFLPVSTHFTVFYEPDVTPRDKGGDGDATVISVKWE
ncbi:MAG TPA: hypothetical protein VJZ27_01745 [Aggregatilineales bacterium]|nr:hypothetical protein [Aggregatilineales bacterium]